MVYVTSTLPTNVTNNVPTKSDNNLIHIVIT